MLYTLLLLLLHVQKAPLVYAVVGLDLLTFGGSLEPHARLQTSRVTLGGSLAKCPKEVSHKIVEQFGRLFSSACVRSGSWVPSCSFKHTFTPNGKSVFGRVLNPPPCNTS